MQEPPAVIRRVSVRRALLVGSCLTAAVAGLLVVTGKPSIAIIWTAFCLADLQPIFAATLVKTTQHFAFVWIGAALLRMPVGLALAGWFHADTEAVTVLPFVYLASLLLSAALAAMIIGGASAEEADTVRDR